MKNIDSDAKVIAEKIIKSEDFHSAYHFLREHLRTAVWSGFILENGKSKKDVRYTILPVTGQGRKIPAIIIKDLIYQARKLKTVALYTDKKTTRNVYCFPVIQGDRRYGFLIISYFGLSCLEGLFLNTFQVFLNTLLKKVQKDMELMKICDTIRPRAIALSTVHTVHRLISSTLKMDELLPRIARLSLQIIRGDKCSVLLLNMNRDRFLYKITVGCNGNKGKSEISSADIKFASLCVKKGAIILRPHSLLVPLVDEDVIGVVVVWRGRYGKRFDASDKEILSIFSEQAVIAIRNANLYSEQQDILIGSVKSLAALMRTKGAVAHRLSTSISNIGCMIGEDLGLADDDIRGLHYAILLHDTSYMTVPDEILSKPSRLTGEEFDVIKKHSAKGIKLIEPLTALKPAMPTILYHHERYDGLGYPNGLKGEDIPLGARIMAVVCAFEAMLTKRPYRVPKTIDDAISEIKNCSGVQFSPVVVDSFLRIMKSKKVRGLLKKEIRQNDK